jgi:uncharacterized protein
MKIRCFFSRIILVPLFIAALTVSGVAQAPAPKNLLVVTTTTGFRHSSIPTAEKVLGDLARISGVFTVDYARVEPNSPEFKGPDGKIDQQKVRAAIASVLEEKMSLESLRKFDGVIFANTTGDLPLPDTAGFLEWLKSGKAFIGMHSATDTFHGYPDFIEMIGGEFQSHGAQVTVECLNEDHRHEATAHFGPSYVVHDEIYIFKNFHRERVRGLLTLDKEPNRGYPGDFPVAWCRYYGNGRVFYTSLGHREDVWESVPYQRHILGGIKWALGLGEGEGTPHDLQVRLSESERQEGFRPLFNGVDLTGWRLRNPDGRQSWSAQNQMLVNTVVQGAGSDLVSEDTFQDFIIRYEYMIPRGSNSGLYLRGRYEVQILDDYLSGRMNPGSNGSIYSIRPPSQFVSRMPGEWQEVEATIRGNRITVVLNGVKVHDNVEVTRPTGGELDRNVGAPGPIMLQGDHGGVAFRNMRIRPLN